MIDPKHLMKVERAWRSFQAVAVELHCEDLLPQVPVDAVENVVYCEGWQRRAHARTVLLALREKATDAGN